MARIGFLHTAEVHVDTFTRLVADTTGDQPAATAAQSLHLVRPELLEYARQHGIDSDLKQDVRRALNELADQGVDVIVCTCSTLSGLAEQPAETGVSVDVIRIDRPMAARAVSRAAESSSNTIVVVTAVESAAAPGIQLIEEEAIRASSNPQIEHLFCDGAWALFEAGDTDAFLDDVTRVIDGIDSSVDVVVIAQASMAGAAERVANPKRVLTSPSMAVSEALNRC